MKKVIIIGATSGIGRELARLYVAEGYTVGITGRRKELLDSLQAEFPRSIYSACFDAAADDNIEHLQGLIGKLGGLDLLIYNSGYGEPSTTLDREIDKQTIAVNVTGFAAITNFAFNYFLEQGRGHIAAISSIAAIRGNSWAPAYSAGKAFMSIYLEGLQIKARKSNVNISITIIQPGFIKTKMAKGNRQFWAAPVDKAVKQVFTAIQRKKRKAYITKRWWIIAQLMKVVPYWIYKRIG